MQKEIHFKYAVIVENTIHILKDLKYIPTYTHNILENGKITIDCQFIEIIANRIPVFSSIYKIYLNSKEVEKINENDISYGYKNILDFFKRKKSPYIKGYYREKQGNHVSIISNMFKIINNG